MSKTIPVWLGKSVETKEDSEYLNHFAHDIARGVDIGNADTAERIDFRAIVGRANLDVVARKSRHKTAAHRTLKQHNILRANALSAEIAMERCAQLLEALNSLCRLLGRHLVGHIDRRGTRSLREGEDMDKSGLDACQKIVSCLKILVRLAGEADNHVDTDKCIGHQATHLGDTLGVLCRRISAAHSTQNLVATALQRDMEMMLELL